MRRLAVVVVLAVFGAAGLAAAGNAEKLSTYEGTVVFEPGPDGAEQVMIRTEAGAEIVLELPPGEAERLAIREQARISVQGVFVGVPRGETVRARILARSVTTGGSTYTVDNPVPLTLRDRERIRTVAREQAELKSAGQSQERDQAGTAAGPAGDSGDQSRRSGGD